MGTLASKLKEEDASKITTICYSEGEKYIGECLPGQVRTGKGTYLFSNGDRYEGEWQNNMKHGTGYFFYSNGELYMGQWENNKRNGRGMYFYQNGVRYDGMWKNHMKEGEGTYYSPDKTIVHGHFKENKKHGICIVKMPDGTVNEEEWYEDKLVSQKRIQSPEQSPRVGDQKKQDLADLEEKIPINKWQAEHVCNWLELKGFSQYKENFRSNHITGKNLFELTEKDFAEELSVKNDADRERMMRELDLLKQIYTKNREDGHNMLKFYLAFEQKMTKNTDNQDHSHEEEKKEEEDQSEEKMPGFTAPANLNHVQVSEYQTMMYNYEQSDHDLLETISMTLGRLCLVDYKEITIGECIGKGGYGEVFKARWLENDIAIKFFGRTGFFNDKRIDIDFLREVAVLSRLRHPNIVLFMGVSITPKNKGALLTELLEGGSLFEHLHKKRTPFTEEQIMKIALDIALGMNYLHGQKILHCDLKSANILMDEHLNVKLADFGLSKLKKRISHKKAFHRVGTMLWMAPEVIREEEYDEASDVYSYGMILWELLARDLPYRGLKLQQIIGVVGYGHKQMIETPKTDNQLILALMKKCLLKDKTERPKFKAIIKYLRGSEKHRKIIAMRELDSVFS